MGFVALIQGVTADIREECGRVAKDVLVEMTAYVNKLGLCRVGAERLSDDSGYCVDSVRHALAVLEAADYLRVHHRWSSVRGDWEFEAWQLSPHRVLAISELYRAEALRSYDNCNVNVRIVSKESQQQQEPPVLEQPTEQPKEPQSTRNPDSTTTTTKNPLEQTFNTPESRKTGSESAKSTDAPASRPTPPGGAAAQKQAPPRSAPLPPRVMSFAPYAAPLADQQREAAAQDLYLETGNMPLEVARWLVAVHGVDTCRSALRVYRKAVDIDNPGGFVRRLVERQSVTVPDDSNPADKYISGKFAAFITYKNDEEIKQ